MTSAWQRLRRTGSKLREGASGTVGKALNFGERKIQHALESRVCIGVTGLSRSGKTTFLTSLINQLQQFETASLPGFSPAISGRLTAVRIGDLDYGEAGRFPYESLMQSLEQEPPRWPQSTRGESSLMLELKVEPAQKGLLFNRRSRHLRLELRDYPGEWLLDLPLLQHNFLQWSALTSKLMSRSPRNSLCADWIARVEAIDLLADVEASTLETLVGEYAALLKRLREQGLCLLQPGAYLTMDGEEEGEGPPLFLPAVHFHRYSDKDLEGAGDNSWWKVMQRAYQRYRKQRVLPFFRDVFSHIDRQVILVDLLGSLARGADAVEDLRETLALVSNAFAYGRQGRLARLLKPRVDRVLFAATKVDQVLSQDHEALRQVLASVVQGAYQRAAFNGAEPLCEAIAAVRCSREEVRNNHDYVIGRDAANRLIGFENAQIDLAMQQVDAEQVALTLPDFQPPPGISRSQRRAIPHIRMDSVLNMLIGDKC